jgi:hypothetical protein
MRHTLLPLVLWFAAVASAQTSTINATGSWQVTGVVNAPWTIQLTQNGTVVTGTVRQIGGNPGPVNISEGTINGSTVTFKAVSPDGARTITFTGTVKANEIAFTRSVEVRNNTPSGAGVFGATAPLQFTATRELSANATPSTTSGAVPSRASGPAGRWQVTGVQKTPWTFEFKVDGTTLTGTVRQNGAPDSPVDIAEGKVDGTTIAFKVRTPDAERAITFRGRVYGNDISFVRQIEVLTGGTRGGNDLYGASSPLQFIAKRAP